MENGGWGNRAYNIIKTTFVVSNDETGKLKTRYIEELKVSLKAYFPIYYVRLLSGSSSRSGSRRTQRRSMQEGQNIAR